jgi:hypothetical protein
MVKIPPWAYLATALVLVLAIGVQQSMQAAYYRGIADDAEQRLELQELVLDSMSATSDSLSQALAEADSALAVQLKAGERALETLTRQRLEAQRRSEAITQRLQQSLDSIQSIELDSIVTGYRIQLVVLDSVVAVERNVRIAESLRADRASELVLGLRQELRGHESKDVIQTIEIQALRKAMVPSLGLRLKADWWIGAAGVAAGYLIWGTRR